MKVVLVLRNNTDWKNMTMKTFFQQNTHFINQRNQDRYLAYIKAWNKQFNMPFFQFRHRVKLLSEATFGNLESVDLIIKDLAIAPSIINGLGDCVILPTDDDDWYNPYLVSELKRLQTDNARWCMAVHDAIRKKVSVKKPGYNTNSYAVYKSGWDKLAPKQREKVLMRHLLTGSLRRTETTDLDVCLSCWNRTLASLTITRNEEEAISTLRERVVKCTKEKKAIPKEADWIKPHVKRMIQLYHDLL